MYERRTPMMNGLSIIYNPWYASPWNLFDLMHCHVFHYRWHSCTYRDTQLQKCKINYEIHIPIVRDSAMTADKALYDSSFISCRRCVLSLTVVFSLPVYSCWRCYKLILWSRSVLNLPEEQEPLISLCRWEQANSAHLYLIAALIRPLIFSPGISGPCASDPCIVGISSPCPLLSPGKSHLALTPTHLGITTAKH